uniref:DUF1279 domain-containing protein n=1 Tax=Aureoumbra lagunensis TaxID=44058 RepID=A0A7S3NL01_9STRA
MVVRLLTAPWILLGPMNIFKVAFINRGSPIAQYIVVEPAETCQAACKIARMWAILFWGLQTIVSIGIYKKNFDRSIAASAKLIVGSILIIAYFENVVKIPVAIAGCIELCCALFLGAQNLFYLFQTAKSILRKYGPIAFFVHWICYFATIATFYTLLGQQIDVASYIIRVPILGNKMASTLAHLDTSQGLARLSVAWSLAFATAPLRLITDVLFTLLLAYFLPKSKIKTK